MYNLVVSSKKNEQGRTIPVFPITKLRLPPCFKLGDAAILTRNNRITFSTLFHNLNLKLFTFAIWKKI
jgi:hypothetical protein